MPAAITRTFHLAITADDDRTRRGVTDLFRAARAVYDTATRTWELSTHGADAIAEIDALTRGRGKRYAGQFTVAEVAAPVAPPAYRKINGEWVVYGPSSVVAVGAVTVTKRDGSTKVERIGSVSAPIDGASVPMVYGYIERETEGYASQLDCGHYSDDRVAGCFMCTHQIGL